MHPETAVERPLLTWGLAGVASVFGIILGVLLFPQRVYDEFLWQYFWGPVVADAHAVGTSGCAVREAGSVEFHRSAAACEAATGIVATPGYTTLSTVSYAIVLLFFLVGVVLLMDRLDIGTEPRFFYALIPFVFLGGALRVVEDINAALFADTGAFLIGVPWVGLLISPLIYFVIFAVAAMTILGSRWLAMRDVFSRYEYPVAGVGSVLLVGVIAIIGYYVVASDLVGFHPAVPIITLGGATVITGIVWIATERRWPGVNQATGFMGAVVIWGHTVDGVANVLSLDWWWAVGLPSGYAPKHVVNRGIIQVTGAVQPTAVSDTIGTAWPFLPLKVAVAVLVVWVFNDEIFEDSPAFAMLLLVAILAVGLGPGTRDFLRATIGI